MKNQILKTIPLILVIALMIPALTVFAAPLAGSVSVTVDSTAKSGIPGSVVTYKITVSNTESVAKDITVSASSASGWTAPVVNPTAFAFTEADPADPSSTTVVTISVPIPSSASSGQNDITTVTIQDTTHGETTTLQLVTTAKIPSAAGRPIIVISSYSTGDKPLYAGREMDLSLVLKNDGGASAYNVVVAFDGADFFPRDTGGVRPGGDIGAGSSNTITQKFLLGDALAWAGVGTIKATVTYNDSVGVAYSEAFTLSVKINEPAASSYYTATPNIPLRPQLVVTSYKTDVDPLQPGTLFDLQLNIKNLGMADATGVTVVLGGGVSSGTNDSGTPQPGGVSGASGDLANFAPIGSSNLIVVGDLKKDGEITVNQKLIVNVSTNPGAYSLKLSFIYNDPKGNRLVDDQVITLLVYTLPQVEVSFYRDAGVFTAGMDNILPLQVTNLGKKSYVLGNMKVTAENAQVMNNVALVGALDPGGYFTLDASLNPMMEGPLNIKVSINYTDDFNQPRFIEQVIPIEVLPMVEMTPPPGEGTINGKPGGEVVAEAAPETFWDKVLRFFKGLLGLDSGVNTPPGEVVPTEDFNTVPIIPKG
jgi:hypothetical protein